MSTRNERLVDHYLRAIGIAGIYVEPAPAGVSVGLVPVVTITAGTGRRILCCAREADASSILVLVKPALAGLDLPAAVAQITAVARDQGVGLTPLETVIGRARTAIHTVNDQIDAMRATGDLRQLNREFREARGRGEVMIYADFLHVRKEQMLFAIATGLRP